MKIKIVFYSLFIHLLSAYSDSLLVKTILLKDIDKITHDAYYNMYISNESGHVFKYDELGSLIQQNSPIKPQQISNIEALNTIRVFCFYKDLQEFNFFDRFLTFENSIKFDQEQIGYARVANVSSDNSLWIVDDVELSLKKYDPTSQKVVQKIFLNSFIDTDSSNIVYVKEYQNILYIVDKEQGVYVFDNMGNYKKTITIKGVNWLSFYQNTLNLICTSHIYKIDLLDATNFIDISIPNKMIYQIQGPHYIYNFYNSYFEVWKLK